MQISDFLVKKCQSSITCRFLQKKLHFGRSFSEQHEKLEITLSLYVQFSEHVVKIYFLSWNFFNYSTYFSHKSVILI